MFSVFIFPSRYNVLTVGTRLFLLLGHDGSFPQEVVQAGAVTAERVVWAHEPEDGSESFRTVLSLSGHSVS